ncbi:MAG: M1 family peptidase [Cytophagales bacterium]|nr:MAG: M1 family peptidase [Cytophagales bacterium]TAF62081.1 MAG: M1 family peptidase [Cytophagales bacterium]
MICRLAVLLCSLSFALGLYTDLWAQNNNPKISKFEQLEELLPTANNYRTTSGAPGHDYWQQRADHVMDIVLDDKNRRLTGYQTITYYNNSPDPLRYLWLQLDQNIFDKNSDANLTETSEIEPQLSLAQINQMLPPSFDGGFKISSVKDKVGKALPYTINKTMMRVELPVMLKKGEVFVFSISWSYNINEQPKLGGRSGYEYFEKDDNCLYEIAQFFPRMAVYSDFGGWQHKQFLGRGEFALTFGNYKVNITVPADHIVAASGELQNADKVLTSKQLQRFQQAKTADRPVLIVTEEEAREAEKQKLEQTKTWTFEAKNVRDFAFASSRKFIWDAMNVRVNNKNTLCMSFYPKEGNPLWGQYSTEVVAHTIKVYSKYTIDYPYPVAISVHGPVWGMEYPMICFNGGRPASDGTYPEGIKHAMISVIIHEVGHNFFPMIINSDERQWSWMDEGLNSFCQYLTEQEWQPNYPSRRGPAPNIVEYMKSDPSTLVPIMQNSESLPQFGNNAYGKPATALNILRETIMGRELFDYSFKEYARRWAFKHPEPADFFRTMEDASAVDLDWFWRAWFYGTEPVDIALSDVKFYTIQSMEPKVEEALVAAQNKQQRYITELKNDTLLNNKRVIDQKPYLKDFYNSYDPLKVTKADQEMYDYLMAALSPEERDLLKGKHLFYELTFKNVGGVVMPLIIEFEYEDGSKTLERIPAEIWRMDNEQVKKVFVFQKKVKNITLDPYQETADIELSNNYFPPRNLPSRFQLFKQQQQRSTDNPMRRSLIEGNR